MNPLPEPKKTGIKRILYYGFRLNDRGLAGCMEPMGRRNTQHNRHHLKTKQDVHRKDNAGKAGNFPEGIKLLSRRNI